MKQIKHNYDEILLLPAYGREYTSKNQALADWRSGKDFKIYNGPYCSMRDITALQALGTVRIVYGTDPAQTVQV